MDRVGNDFTKTSPQSTGEAGEIDRGERNMESEQERVPDATKSKSKDNKKR